MKKLLTIAAFAFGAVALVATANAEEFHIQEDASKLTNCELLESYKHDVAAIPGSYVEVNCQFGTNNIVTVTTDDQVLDDCHLDIKGAYGISFKNVITPQTDVYYAYQRIEGTRPVTWDVVPGRELPEIADNNVHVSDSNHIPFESTLFYETYFGSWSNGPSEKIAIYACIK